MAEKSFTSPDGASPLLPRTAGDLQMRASESVAAAPPYGGGPSGPDRHALHHQQAEQDGRAALRRFFAPLLAHKSKRSEMGLQFTAFPFTGIYLLSFSPPPLSTGSAPSPPPPSLLSALLRMRAIMN